KQVPTAGPLPAKRVDNDKRESTDPATCSTPTAYSSTARNSHSRSSEAAEDITFFGSLSVPAARLRRTGARKILDCLRFPVRLHSRCSPQRQVRLVPGARW